MLSIIIWFLIWFFLVVGVASAIICVVTFLTSEKATPVMWFAQICAVCFVIVLVASIAAKGVGL
jgi:hypothetical protein